jgi:hypothetical protein
MSIIVKESEKFVLEFREFFFIGEASIILHIIIKKMDGLWFEKSSQFRILMNNISQVYLVNIGIVGSVSDSGPKEHPGQQSKSFKSESQIPELVKEDG